MAPASLGIPSHRHKERGDGLVEFALILPVLLLILFSILDLGRAVYAFHVVANCAREGARFATVSSGDPADIAAVVQAAAVGLDLTQLTATVTYPTTDSVRVNVSYTFELVTPLLAQVLGRSSLLLHSAATMYTGY